MRKITVLFLILCLLLSAAACGPVDPNAGKYVCVALESADKNAKPGDEWIILETNGKGSVNIGLELNMKWHMNNGALIVETEFIANTYTGTFRDGVITLTVEDATYTFVKEGQEDAWVKAQQSAIVPEETETVAVDVSAVGHYTCTSITLNGEQTDPENRWIDLYEDGTALVYFGLRYPGVWQLENGQLTITQNNEETYSGSLQDGEMTLLGDATYLLERTGEPGSGTEDTLADLSKVIRVGSTFGGTLKVKWHEGEGILADGEYDITALIGESEDGTFFEVYYKNRQTDRPIVSFWVNLHQNFMEPIIDEDAENAWIFEETLDDDDAFDLTMFLDTENQLSFYYEYDTKDEEADLYFRFWPENQAPQE